MIIQVRGTSGSGKTTVVKAVMDEIGGWEETHNSDVCRSAKGRPVCYNNSTGIVVLGPYHTACGGCDFLRKPDGGSMGVGGIYQFIQSLDFHYLLCEGLLLSEDVKWTLQLRDVRALFLATDPEECLRRVVKRQAGREPADPARVRRKLMTRVRTIERARLRLEAAGVYCHRVSVAQATKRIIRWLT